MNDASSEWLLMKPNIQVQQEKSTSECKPWTYTFSLIPKSCKNVQYDFRKYVSSFKSIPSLLDGEFSSVSFLEKYQRPTSSCFSWEFLEGLLSEVEWCEESPGKMPAMYMYLPTLRYRKKKKKELSEGGSRLFAALSFIARFFLSRGLVTPFEKFSSLQGLPGMFSLHPLLRLTTDPTFLVVMKLELNNLSFHG